MLMALTTLTTMGFNVVDGILSEDSTKITMGIGVVIITVFHIITSMVTSYLIAAFLRLLRGVGIGRGVSVLLK